MHHCQPYQIETNERLCNCVIDSFRRCHEYTNENITWFFHINSDSEPIEAWNDFENYYLGDDYIDWIGVSVYELLEEDKESCEFSEKLDKDYKRIIKLYGQAYQILTKISFVGTTIEISIDTCIFRI